jgi:hypothetical protein
VSGGQPERACLAQISRGPAVNRGLCPCHRGDPGDVVFRVTGLKQNLMALQPANADQLIMMLLFPSYWRKECKNHFYAGPDTHHILHGQTQLYQSVDVSPECFLGLYGVHLRDGWSKLRNLYKGYFPIDLRECNCEFHPS